MSKTLQLLNIGCGQHFHSEWKNVDFVSVDPAVEQRDLRKGIGEPESTYDMVYHSHVLEHFSPDAGRKLLEECLGVLKPGGILRIAVPDLEQIARLYLANLDAAWDGDDQAGTRYQWMKMELLDQMTRHQSGGSMGPFMVQAEGETAEFVNRRLGLEVSYAKSKETDSKKHGSRSAGSKPGAAAADQPRKPGLGARIKRKFLKWLIGKDGLRQLEIGRFRDSGEVHRWMYDRYSLKQLCEEIGFDDFVVRSESESYLDGFARYQLDSVEGQVRKPDSLFVECKKPLLSASVGYEGASGKSGLNASHESQSLAASVSDVA